jgi:hypothetical protein
MRGFLAEHLGVFDPDDIQILVTAFDKAWEAVRASGVVFDKARADTYGAALGPTIRLMPTLLAGEGNEDREGQYKTRP